MRDPDVLQPSDYEFYQTLARWQPEKTPRSAEKLTHDVNKAHDNIKALVSERDRLQEALSFLAEQLAKEKQWRKWLTTALVSTWVLWGLAFYKVFSLAAPYILKGLSH